MCRWPVICRLPVRTCGDTTREVGSIGRHRTSTRRPRREAPAPACLHRAGALVLSEAVEIGGGALEMPEARLWHGDGRTIFAAYAHTRAASHRANGGQRHAGLGCDF